MFCRSCVREGAGAGYLLCSVGRVYVRGQGQAICCVLLVTVQDSLPPQNFTGHKPREELHAALTIEGEAHSINHKSSQSYLVKNRA